jgi:hypothetical protein
VQEIADIILDFHFDFPANRKRTPDPVSMQCSSQVFECRVFPTAGQLFPSDGGGRYAEYCYRADGRLAELRSEADASAVCDDAYFRCQLTLPREWFYLLSGKIINVIHDDQRLLKSEKTNLSFQPNRSNI